MSSSTRNRSLRLAQAARGGPDQARTQERVGRRARGLAALALPMALLALTGCSTLGGIGQALGGSDSPQVGQVGFVQGFLGGAVADEPRAALLARDVLSAGGSATDAAVAAGFGLTVTLPSRAGLGGGGACLVYDFNRNATEALLFPASRPEGGGNGSRPAAIPLMARGLYALYSRNPRRPFEELMAPAEQLARFGTEVSRALAQDLAVVAGPLFADPGARAIFGGPDGRPLPEGGRLLQPDLAGTLSALRVAGVGDLYQGGLARRLEELSPQLGGPLTVDQLRPAIPSVTAPLQMRLGNDTLSFLPPPADGGLAAMGAFQALQGGAGVDAASQRGLALARAWRDGRGAPAALLANASLPAGHMPELPASSSLVVIDRNGNAVSCAFSMNNLFGTGRVLPQLGFMPAAAPGVGRVEPPLLSAMLVHNANMRTFRYAGAASGQGAAPIALALTAAQHLLNGAPLAQAVAAVPEPGRGNAAACSRYLPTAPSSCRLATDARGAGLAAMGLE